MVRRGSVAFTIKLLPAARAGPNSQAGTSMGSRNPGGIENVGGHQGGGCLGRGGGVRIALRGRTSIFEREDTVARRRAGASFQATMRLGKSQGAFARRGEGGGGEQGFGYLHDNTVASSKSGPQFPGRHENGEVPGDDLPYHPQGLLVNGGLHFARERTTGHYGAMDLVGPACIVPQVFHRQGDIPAPAPQHIVE